MRRTDLACITEVAEDLDVHRNTVHDLVKKLGIAPKPMPRDKRARGLDLSDVARIRRALGMSPAAAP